MRLQLCITTYCGRILIAGDVIMKTSKDVIGSVVKTAQMGQMGLEHVLAKPISPALRQSLRNQSAVYDRLEKDALALCAQREWQVQELGPVSRAMSKTTANLRLSGKNLDSKIAAMVIKGCTTGMIKGLKNLHSAPNADTAVTSLSQRLLDAEAESICQMKSFL